MVGYRPAVSGFVSYSYGKKVDMVAKVNMTYMKAITDDFGIWQHSKGETIDRARGYALDDSARALIVYILAGDMKRAKACFNYLATSQKGTGFVGFFDKDHLPLDDESSLDAYGLAMWALAFAMTHGLEEKAASRIFQRATRFNTVRDLPIRTQAYLLMAFTILGDAQHASIYAGNLNRAFDADLGWFEDYLRYANAVLPWSLIEYSRRFGSSPEIDAMIRTCIATLETYCRIGILPAPIGNHSWQRIGDPKRDIYGQQPIDAGFMVLMYLGAYEYFGDEQYRDLARDWFSWFSGNNIYNQTLIREDGACADGLDEPWRWGNGISDNYGSESTIMYLWSEIMMKRELNT